MAEIDESLKKELEEILREAEGREVSVKELLKPLKQEYIRTYAPKYGLLGAFLLWGQIEREARRKGYA